MPLPLPPCSPDISVLSHRMTAIHSFQVRQNKRALYYLQQGKMLKLILGPSSYNEIVVINCNLTAKKRNSISKMSDMFQRAAHPEILKNYSDCEK